MNLCSKASLLLLAAALSAAAANPNPYIDMTSDSINGPGIGFAFSSGDSMSSATVLLSKLAPTCKVGSLDELYFYVYGCRLHSNVVEALAANITGFLYSSDKSLTDVTVSPLSLLLANVWNLTLHYASSTLCILDAGIIASRRECVVVDTCAAAAGPASLSVGCGSLTCEGCALVDLFSMSNFTNGSFS